jgi:hypothetical protein
LKSENLYSEAKVINNSKGLWYKKLYLWMKKIRLFLMKIKIKLGLVDWEAEKKLVMYDTDYQKFDDTLRMVISGNSAQREKLTEYLEKQYQSGKLLYGIHVSDRVLITCLVYESQSRHIAFVDGADGGYALAAKSLKEKLRLNS